MTIEKTTPNFMREEMYIAQGYYNGIWIEGSDTAMHTAVERAFKNYQWILMRMAENRTYTYYMTVRDNGFNGLMPSREYGCEIEAYSEHEAIQIARAQYAEELDTTPESIEIVSVLCSADIPF